VGHVLVLFQWRGACGFDCNIGPVITRLALRVQRTLKEAALGILWTIIIGFVAGVIAKFLHPGSNEPSGFIVTTLLGIAGAFVATYLGQSLGFYRADEGAGLIGAVVGAVIVLVVWSLFARRRA
jgi:uncharacterized membrane protein YeaQ/YmgE (transglycosylase-associated protein family)